MLKEIFERVNHYIEETPVVRMLKKPLNLHESYTYKAITLPLVIATQVKFPLHTKLFENILIFIALIIVLLTPFLPNVILFVLILLAFVFFALALMDRGNFKAVFSDFDILLFLFTWITISVASAGKSIIQMLYIWFIFGSFLMIYTLINSTINTNDRLLLIKSAYCYSGGAVALYQLLENVVPFNTTILGQYYIFSIPICVEMFFLTKSVWKRVIFGSIVVLMLFSVTIVWSSGSWAWAAFILAFFLVMKDWRLLLAGGIGLLFVPVFRTGITGLLSEIGKTSSQMTIPFWKAIKEILIYYWNYSLNESLASAAISLGCFLLVFILLLKETFSTLRQGKTAMVCAILAAVGAGVTGLLYSDISTNLWLNYRSLLVFWVFISIYAAGAKVEAVKDKEKVMIIDSKINANFKFIDAVPLLLGLFLLFAALKGE